MRVLLILAVCSTFLYAQQDPAWEAYKAWDSEHQESDHKARAQSLLEISADWVAKWPDSKLAWQQRRDALLGTRSDSPDLWKQVDENLIRLYPPHTFASMAAYDWVTAGVNLKDAEALLASEIDFLETRTWPVRPRQPTLADLVEEASFSSPLFGAWCTLATAEIKMKEFDRAHTTIAKIRGWLDGDFKRFYDQDPLSTFPDYEAKYFTLSAQLAEAEGRNTDALAFYQHVITNPYFRREYGGWVKQTRALWKQLGGTDEGWATFSMVPSLPPGVPAGYPGMPFEPWTAVDYKLPEMNVPDLSSRTWTTKDFEGKTTLVYVWASWCGPCWPHLPGIQKLYDAVKNRRDIQIVTLSVDEDRQKMASFMKEKGYSFPVLVDKAYVDTVIPHVTLGQSWVVDRTASVRLWRVSGSFVGSGQAFIDESIYKLTGR